MRCCRAGARLAFSAAPSVTRSVDFSLPKPEEAMAVPVGPRHRLGDLGQAAESLAIPGEALLQDHDPLKPALPFTNEQRAGLQCDALPSLWGAPVEADAGAIVLLGSKVPPDRFVEIAESVRLESIGEHPHQEPAREMGRRFAAQMRAPLTAQSIEIASLEIRHDRQNRDIARRGSPRCCRHRTLRYQPGLGFPAAHADHAARFRLTFGVTAAAHRLRLEAPEIR